MKTVRAFFGQDLDRAVASRRAEVVDAAYSQLLTRAVKADSFVGARAGRNVARHLTQWIGGTAHAEPEVLSAEFEAPTSVAMRNNGGIVGLVGRSALGASTACVAGAFGAMAGVVAAICPNVIPKGPRGNFADELSYVDNKQFAAATTTAAAFTREASEALTEWVAAPVLGLWVGIGRLSSNVIQAAFGLVGGLLGGIAGIFDAGYRYTYKRHFWVASEGTGRPRNEETFDANPPAAPSFQTA